MQDTVDTIGSKIADTKSEYFDPVYAPHILSVFETESLNKFDVYQKFVELYGPLVTHLVGRHNKVTLNSRTREIIQEIYLQFKQAQAIEKFLCQANYSIPEVINGEKACRALGVSWDTFCFAVKLFVESPVKAPWMALPVRGEPGQEEALYNTEDIIRLSAEDFFDPDSVGKMDTGCIVPVASKKHFQAYVSRTVHNRFANYCRTEERRNRERVGDTFPELRSLVDDPTPWENRLPSKVPGNQEAMAELGLLIRKIESTPIGGHIDELLGFCVQGYSLEEAIKRLTVSATQKRAATKILQAWL